MQPTAAVRLDHFLNFDLLINSDEVLLRNVGDLHDLACIDLGVFVLHLCGQFRLAHDTVLALTQLLVHEDRVLCYLLDSLFELGSSFYHLLINKLNSDRAQLEQRALQAK